MKVFITGASGFLGRHVVDRLIREKAEITALVRSVSPVGYLKEKKKAVFTFNPELFPAHFFINLFGRLSGHLGETRGPQCQNPQNTSFKALRWSVDPPDRHQYQGQCRRHPDAADFYRFKN